MNLYRAAAQIYQRAGGDAHEHFMRGTSAQEYTNVLLQIASVSNPKMRRYISDMTAADWVRFASGNVAPLMRVDFTLLTLMVFIAPETVPAQRWQVTKYYSRERRIRDIKPQGFDIKTALQWCEEHGFVVRRWGASQARAWRGKITPVRTRSQIQRMARARSRFLSGGRRPAWLPDDVDDVQSLDMAYDL